MQSMRVPLRSRFDLGVSGSITSHRTVLHAYRVIGHTCPGAMSTFTLGSYWGGVR